MFANGGILPRGEWVKYPAPLIFFVERFNMEKIKNLPAMRLAAFAVAVAIILGLSASMLSFTASAETAEDVVSHLGTLGNLVCIIFIAGQIVDII